MPIHPARRTLERDVLPYLVSARRLRRQWFVLLHSIFGYATDVIVALTTIGVTAPLLTLLGPAGNTTQDMPQSQNLSTALASVPTWLYFPTVILIVAWIFFRVVFNREEGQKRAVLAKSCTQVLRQAEASLPAALSSKDPMPALNELLEKRIRPTVDRNIQDNSWPWTPFAPEIDSEVQREVDGLCTRYASDWATPDPLGLRQPIPGGAA